MTSVRLLSLIPSLAFALGACTAQEGSNEVAANHTALAAELLKAADGDLRIVEASGGDVEKARLLAAGKRLAQPVPASVASPAAAPVRKPACWNPPSGPNIIDDPNRPIRMDEMEEIERATGRAYVEGDTIWGRAEDRCPA